MTYAKKINKAIAGATNLNKQTSELGQLSKLLSDKVISTIFKENNEYRNQNSTLIYSSIHTGWIDKIPLAKFTNPTNDFFGSPITQKVEVGDALIIDHHMSLDNLVEKSKAFIIQAKRAKGKKLPNVPVYQGNTVNNSSLKELALMDNWPEFALYKTARSKSSVISNIKLPPSSFPLSYGGFVVCPPTLKKIWPAHWMCAKDNKYGTTFNITFGDLLASFFNIGNYAINKFNYVGHEFMYRNYKDEWSKLINTLIKISSDYNTPRAYSKIFGENRHKIKSSHLCYFSDLFSVLETEQFQHIELYEKKVRLVNALEHFMSKNCHSKQIDNIKNSGKPKRGMPIIIYSSIGLKSFFNDAERD